ncbi:DNA-directed RNA polymerase subunit beta [Candidatus Carsonella ruddii]|uniref:DNA-directed RNA polymerase subunit beta n=2 Tax=Carsonella ruddii TaxID=114186 RepID=J7H038_CARRU|nr:DNA-directed RNA polymerase subunit beta [Candidatus Carsonella ruddii]AFP83645.1 RNA polymerase beta subunit [Candidatus Carsonella ruddii CE isolate Thao2000]
MNTFNRFCLSNNLFNHKCLKPYLIHNQINSFNNFLKNNKNSFYSIKKILKNYFPIINSKKNIFLKIKKIILEKPFFNDYYSKKKNIHYFANLYIIISIFYIKENFFIEKKLFFGSIPFMTKKGNFVINGTERILISQFTKSNGIFFFLEKKLICKIIPKIGDWIDFSIEKKFYFIFNNNDYFDLNYFLICIGIKKYFFFNYFIKKINLKIIKGKKKFFFLLNKKNNFIFKNFFFLCISNKKINFYFYKKYIINNKKIKKMKEIINFINIFFLKKIFFIKVFIFKYKIEEKFFFLLIKNFFLKKTDILFSKNKGSIFNYFKKIFIKKKFVLSNFGYKRINTILNNNNLYFNYKIIIEIINKMLKFYKFNLLNDNFDSLENKIILNSGKLISKKFEFCIKIIKKSIFYKIKNLKKEDELNFLIDDNIITINLKDYFCNNELSQFLDQNNPLAEISHNRKISLINLKGVNKENCGFDIRDIHYSHYSKICPIDTPEGHNIGLINSFSFYSKTNKHNLISTLYKISINGKIIGISFFDHKIEKINYISNFLTTIKTIYGEIFTKPIIEIRYKSNYKKKKFFFINFIEFSGDQLCSIGASLIPFLEHNDANRCLMGSNMQRQATPLINSQQPLIGTGNELIIGLNSGYNIISKINGIVLYTDYYKIIIKNKNKLKLYNLKKYNKTNQNTIFHQNSLVNINQIIKKGDLLADSYSTKYGEISLGINIKVAFMSWYGYNFEDSIIISKKIFNEEKFSSLHIYEFICILKHNENCFEILSNECFDVKNNIKKGIINIGEFVKPKDILIGKMIPKNKKENSPEEKLFKVVFSDNNFNYYEQPLLTPKNIKGIVIHIEDFKLYILGKNIIKILYFEQLKYINKCLNNYFYEIFFYYMKKINYELFNQKIIYKNKIFYYNKLNINLLFKIKCLNKKINFKLKIFKKLFLKYLKIKKKKYYYKKKFFLKYEDFEKNILRIIKIKIVVKKNIKIGDKMSGRHGNKGVVSKIVEEESMPYDKYGNRVDLILNPLGIPSRMNVGQLLESYLGISLEKINNFFLNINNFRKNYFFKNKILISLLFKKILKKNINILNFNNIEIIKLIKKIKNGFKICIHNFQKFNELKIKQFIKTLGFSSTGKIFLFDGYNGKKYIQLINVGIIYFMKLNHLASDKMYSRSVGPYSLITQQPLGGKSNLGGQRLGEMEVWALEAYGASNLLKEMLTIKSDDIIGRVKLYKNIISGNQNITSGVPESFQVLLKEIKALCFDIKLL